MTLFAFYLRDPDSIPAVHRVAQSSEQAPFTSEIVGRSSHWTNDTYMRRVSQRSAESRGFSPGTLVSSHREC
jgi:hypothetical protein